MGLHSTAEGSPEGWGVVLKACPSRYSQRLLPTPTAGINTDTDDTDDTDDSPYSPLRGL